jgi:hypothetical protein
LIVESVLIAAIMILFLREKPLPHPLAQKAVQLADRKQKVSQGTIRLNQAAANQPVHGRNRYATKILAGVPEL